MLKCLPRVALYTSSSKCSCSGVIFRNRPIGIVTWVIVPAILFIASASTPDRRDWWLLVSLPKDTGNVRWTKLPEFRHSGQNEYPSTDQPAPGFESEA